MKSAVAMLLLACFAASLCAADEAHIDPAPEASPGTGPAQAAWALSPAELDRLAGGAILAEADLAPSRAAADVRAAIQIDAPPEGVFRTLTDCAQALRFIPHLKHCAVVETAPDGTWQTVEQQVDYGWLAPRARYVFRADYERPARIRFRHVSGDFRENEGVWEFRPAPDGRGTLVIYRARVVPAFYVPRWMMRSMLKRDLPELMRGLRLQAEGRATPKGRGQVEASHP